MDEIFELKTLAEDLAEAYANYSPFLDAPNKSD